MYKWQNHKPIIRLSAAQSFLGVLQKILLLSPFSCIDIQSGKSFIYNFFKCPRSQAYSWIDGTPSFLHPLKIISLVIIKLVWTQLLMCLSIPFRIDPSPRTNYLGLNRTWVPDIDYHVSHTKIPGPYHRTIGHEVIVRPQQFGVSFRPILNNLEGVK